jgi:hypothetical protein
MRRAAVLLLAVFATAFASACDRRTPSQAPSSAGSSSAAASSSTPTSAEPSGNASSVLARGTPCGDLGCAQFDSPKDAFLAAVAGDPRIIAIGEAHAPKGAVATSAAKRFSDELLPLLAGRASDLLVELMMPPTGCVDAAAEVREKQAPATSKQAPTNQNEYLAMGEKARSLGIVPDMLRPSCADLDAVRDAGGGAIEASLAMIARLSTAQAGKLLDRDTRTAADRGKAVVVYGGMLHNDLDPPADRATWSYAPALDAKSGGKLVAVDLVVPEFIVDDATWKSLPWYAHYDGARLGGKTTLFRLGPKSFVIVFPRSGQ